MTPPILDNRALDRLQTLATRFSSFGLTPDLWALSAVELLGVLAFLERIAQEVR